MTQSNFIRAFTRSADLRISFHSFTNVAGRGFSSFRERDINVLLIFGIILHPFRIFRIYLSLFSLDNAIIPHNPAFMPYIINADHRAVDKSQGDAFCSYTAGFKPFRSVTLSIELSICKANSSRQGSKRNPSRKTRKHCFLVFLEDSSGEPGRLRDRNRACGRGAPWRKLSSRLPGSARRCRPILPASDRALQKAPCSDPFRPYCRGFVGSIGISHSTGVRSARLKGGYFHSSGLLFLIPDTSFSYRFTPWYSAQAKYFFGYTTDSYYSHSLQLKNIFNRGKTLSGTLITTAIHEKTVNSENFLWSAGVRLQVLLADRYSLRYLFQYHCLADDKWGVENGITLDWKF